MQAFQPLKAPDPPRSRERRSAERYYWGAALVLLGAYAVLAWLVRMPGIETAGDDAMYVILGRSLRSFGYHELFNIESPLHVKYPPVHPALLALWETIVGEGFERLVLVGIATSTAALGFTFAALRRLWSPAIALVCLAALALNPHLVSGAGTLYSEPPYMLFSAIALWALARAAPSPRLLLVAGAAALLAALTRSIGITLLFAVGAHWLLERRFAAAAAFAGLSAATAGAWLVVSVLAAEEHQPGGSYLADATFSGSGAGGAGASFAHVLLVRAQANLSLYLTDALPWQMALPSVPGTRVDNVLAIATLIVGLGAGVFVMWKRWRAAALYLLAYGGLLLLWPWALHRFVDPLVPWLIPTVLLGVGIVAGRIRPKWAFPALLALGLAISLNGAARTALLVRDMSGCERGGSLPDPRCVRRDQASYFAAVEYIRQRTPPDAVFLTAKYPTLYYYTGRRSLSFEKAIAHGPATFVDYLRARGVDYILLASLDSRELSTLAKLLQANCRALAFEAFFPARTYLFRLRSSDEPARADAACEALTEYRHRNLGRDFSRDP